MSGKPLREGGGLGASCPPKPHPLAPSPLRGEGERIRANLAEIGEADRGPPLSTQWRGAGGEASKGRTLAFPRRFIPLRSSIPPPSPAPATPPASSRPSISRASSRARTGQSQSSGRRAARKDGNPAWRVPSRSPGPRMARSRSAISKPSVVEAKISSLRRAVSASRPSEGDAGGGRSSPDSPAELVELGEAEALGALDHHHSGGGHVEPDLDHRRRHQGPSISPAAKARRARASRRLRHAAVDGPSRESRQASRTAPPPRPARRHRRGRPPRSAAPPRRPAAPPPRRARTNS